MPCCDDERTCTGACCVVFQFGDPTLPRFDRIEDADFLRDMLIPLSLVEAAERLEKYGVEPFWIDESSFDWDGRTLSDPTRRLMTCRHWDGETRLCTAYEDRPHMCREYPYYKSDCDYRCGFSLTHEQMWDRALRLGGPEEGTPLNIVRGYN